MKIQLNKNLLTQQQINPETEASLQATHAMLELILENPELVGIDSVSEVVRGLEFALQELWNFPLSQKHHKHQFMIKGCECPKMDNDDMIRSGQPYRYYNMECPIHSARFKEPEQPEETRLDNQIES